MYVWLRMVAYCITFSTSKFPNELRLKDVQISSSSTANYSVRVTHIHTHTHTHAHTHTHIHMHTFNDMICTYKHTNKQTYSKYRACTVGTDSHLWESSTLPAEHVEENERRIRGWGELKEYVQLNGVTMHTAVKNVHHWWLHYLSLRHCGLNLTMCE